MGTWGYEPRDGDHPADLFWRVEDAAGRALAKLFARKRVPAQDRWARVGTLQEAMRRGITVPLRLVQQAVEDIDVATDDEKFVEGWKDPGRFLDNALRFKMEFERLAALPPPRPSHRARHRVTGMKRPLLVQIPMGWPDVDPRLTGIV